MSNETPAMYASRRAAQPRLLLAVAAVVMTFLVVGKMTAKAEADPSPRPLSAYELVVANDL